MEEPDGYRAFVAARSESLLRSAWLLTGDHDAAQDLVQTALIKTWLRWKRITRKDAPEAYTRKVMVSTFLSARRRRWRGETPTAHLPDVSSTSVDADIDARLDVASALSTLTARQRAVVVLRFFDDLTEAQAAAVLGCSIGTIKSQTFKALGRLRDSPGLREVFTGEEIRNEHN